MASLLPEEMLTGYNKDTITGKKAFGEGATTEQTAQGIDQGIGALVKTGASIAKISENLKTVDDLDQRGNRLGRKDFLGNAMAGMEAGSALGEFGGPGGKLIGGAIGLAGGVLATAFTKDPTIEEMAMKEKQFQLGEHVKTTAPEDTFTKQQLMAKEGMEVTNGVKEIEVEKDEIVLRKIGKTYKKVADFKGGKTHQQGGEDYMAVEGDVIIPRIKAAKAEFLIANRRWSALESMRQKLPTDTGKKEFALGGKAVKTGKYNEGTKGVKTKNPRRTAKWDKFLDQPGVREKIISIAEKHGFAPERLMAVIEFETAGSMDPAQKSIVSSATGLIQFMEATAKALGTTTEDLAGMTVTEQLEYVGKYYDKYHKKGDDPYDTVVASGAGSKKDNDILYPKDSAQAKANPSWQDTSGNVTKASARQAVKDFEGYSLTPDQAPAKQTVSPEIIRAEVKAEEAYIKDPKKRGYFHTGDPIAQIRKAIGGPTADPLQGFVDRTFNISQRLAGVPTEQVGFTDAGLRDQGDNFMSWLQKGNTINYLKGKKGVTGQDLSGVKGKDITWTMGDVMRTWSAGVSKLVTGENFDSGIPNAIAEILDGSSPEEINTLVAEAQAAGIIDDKGVYFIKDVYNNPGQFWTSDMTTGLVTDLST
ncbi:hypothetical protein LCGC14_0984260, partial [marine sediment metagenome]